MDNQYTKELRREFNYLLIRKLAGEKYFSRKEISDEKKDKYYDEYKKIVVRMIDIVKELSEIEGKKLDTYYQITDAFTKELKGVHA